MKKALAWRAAMEKHKGKVLYEAPDGAPYYATDEFLSQISDEANEFLDTHGEKAATNFYKIAKGEGTPLRQHVDTWLSISFLYVLMERGTLRSVKLGGRRLIPREALQELLTSREPSRASARGRRRQSASEEAHRE